MHSPTRQYGEALVVFEGRRRLIWSGPDDGHAAPKALWPDAPQRRSVQRRLDRRAPLLVIVDHDTTPVALLPEELPSVPEELQRLVECDDGLPGLRVPLLDWLPEPLRGRGLAFLAEVDERRAGIPQPLLPDLLTDQDSGNPVRFARRTTGRPLVACQLAAAVGHLFGPRPFPAPGNAVPLFLPAQPGGQGAGTTGREPITTGRAI